VAGCAEVALAEIDWNFLISSGNVGLSGRPLFKGWLVD
jgi:hypothetical protein